jgi:CheY-like chemotaxis protein
MSRRVLVVDDDADTVEVLAELLEDAGYEVAVATDGIEALVALYWSPRPDAVLLDLWMPVVPGGDVLEQLRRDATFADVPVVLLTAAPVPDSLRCAANATLSKPFDLSTLLALLEQLVPPAEAGGAPCGLSAPP